MGAESCEILLRVSRYLMNERSERVRDRLRHEKRKSISQSNIMHHFVYYINTLPVRESRVYSRFKKRTR